MPRRQHVAIFSLALLVMLVASEKLHVRMAIPIFKIAKMKITVGQRNQVSQGFRPGHQKCSVSLSLLSRRPFCSAKG